LKGEDGSFYYTLQDIKYEYCLDESSNNWNISVNNLRVPITKVVCSKMIDLHDCKDNNLLTEKIQNCNDYKNVIDKLKLDIIGTYTPQKEYKFDALIYDFTTGIEKHEEQHLNDMKPTIVDTLNKLLKNINSKEFTKNEFPCKKDLIKKLFQNVGKNRTKNIDIQFLSIIANFNKTIMNKYFGSSPKEYYEEAKWLAIYFYDKNYLDYIVDGKILIPNSELRADANASSTFEQIKDNLIFWAQGKEYLNDCKDYNGATK
jgi:hypothetical protein